MKKLLLISFLIPLFSGVLKAQQEIVSYPGYTSYWNAKTLIPDSVIWITLPHKKAAKRSAGFHATGDRVNETKDYAHSGYDIGHNCNASDENGNAIDEYNSFDYVNTFPQRPNNNRLTWLALENRVRDIADSIGSVRNKVYWIDTLGTIGTDHIFIPKYTVKEIWYGTLHEKYIMPNRDTVNKHPYTYYRVE